METRCFGSQFHTETITADDDDYDPRYIRGTWSAIELNKIGYCSRCHTAMQWIDGAWDDWPDANIVPHCDRCHSSIHEGQHHLINVTVELDTFHPFVPMIRDVPGKPVVDAATFCGPYCLVQTLLFDERLKDVFGR